MKSARWLVHPSSLKTETARKTITNPPQKNEFCNYYYRHQTAEIFALNSQNYPWRSCLMIPSIALQCKKWQIHARGRRANSWKYAWSSRKASHIWREEWISSDKTKSFSHRYFLQVAISFIHLYFIIAVYFQKKFKGKGIEKTFWCNFELVFYK